MLVKAAVLNVSLKARPPFDNRAEIVLFMTIDNDFSPPLRVISTISSFILGRLRDIRESLQMPLSQTLHVFRPNFNFSGRLLR